MNVPRSSSLRRILAALVLGTLLALPGIRVSDARAQVPTPVAGQPETCRDSDGDGLDDCRDGCAGDPAKTSPGACGCGVADTDRDGDGTADCIDGCPGDAAKIAPGVCGCGRSDRDRDNDTFADCVDGCPLDPAKQAPGACGCGNADTDSDGDGTADCIDGCPNDAAKTAAGQCGCGRADTDSDNDGTADCNDQCANDPAKTRPGICGCGVVEDTGDTDRDRTINCRDGCPSDAAKTDPGLCGCGFPDTDSDGDGAPDCRDACPADSCKIGTGVCGCGVADAMVNGQIRCSLDPCDTVNTSNVVTKRWDDGHSQTFRLNEAMKTTRNGMDVWYINDTADSTTYMCIRNTNTVGLTQTEVTPFYDWQWIYRYAKHAGSDNSQSAITTRLDGGMAALQGHLTDSKACYLCGYARWGGCFDPEVELQMADGSRKAARDIAAGDRLWNPVTKETVTVRMVIEGAEALGLVELSDGDFVLRVSQEHPVLTANGLMRAKDLKAGDIVFDAQGGARPLVSVEILPVAEGQRVINFVVGEEGAGPQGRMLLSDGIVTGDFLVQRELRETAK